MRKKTPILRLDGCSLRRDDLHTLSRRGVSLALTPEATNAVERSRAVVDRLLVRQEVSYGINTGFGRFCRVRISPNDVLQLQLNLVRSHGAGVGEALPPEIVRLAVAFRANTLARGNSGVRAGTVELLLAIYNEDIVPWIPSQGSVGASGDLAPLAHLAQVLIGEGQATVDGRLMPGKSALESRGLSPLRLEAKEGLSLINGVQPSCAVLTDALLRADRILDGADFAAAVTLDALLGSFVPFDPRIHAVRPHRGQEEVAARFRRLLQGSAINESHRDCGRVQDAYSLRCIPQVHGAVRDAIRFIWNTLITEVNSATDNPLVFPEESELLSGGNFHGAPIAYAADLLAIVLADLGAMSERRTERLVNPDLSGLPPFLSGEDGVESGFMMAQVTAASLASENKTLAHPASVDSIPTSAGTEDHVSMSMFAARKAREVALNLERIVAIELLVAAAALEHRRPLASGREIEAGIARFRERVPKVTGDRNLSEEIEQAAQAVRDGILP